ncbi:carboxypeptidase N subunit 2-like [Cylas formicarius]|uniref:carboxypeptidase N subunit 2-like n=1 Tax=Cylas formicarius TaxID=197179 RepID=UPI0029584A75|nr:carboxypeptidase N subunit 2-like [Cylas formicarius]XP_060515927.1 carboxypeptidase N subunit 2-like [Cylas formicarius]
MPNWLVLLTLVAASSALPQIKPLNCVQNCTCKEILPNILDVVGCDKPLTINSTLFEHLDKKIITVISFSNVIINQIKEDAFKHFAILEDVIIEKAQIGSIDSKAFDNIRKVKFANCGFEDEPTLYSQQLEELHFGNCKLDSIPPLDELFSLMFLNLSGNYIRDIDIMSFAELFDLEVLILSNNELSRIPANLFVNNQELNSLYLDNNPLKFFHMNTSNKLETLSLKNCHLTSFDQTSTYRLKSLSELNLSNNNLKSVSGKDFAYMIQLSVLDLSNNNLSKLDNDVFKKNAKLQKLTLDNNNFKTLPNFTLPDGDIFQIYTFSCRNCGLTNVGQNTFKNMPAIISLQLSHNNLTNVENTFGDIKSLKILDISYNQIQVLSTKAFQHNRNLENLNVAGNPLMALNPEVFAATKAIRKIDASNTKLYKLWSNKNVILESVKKLIVSSNQLTTLSVEDFKIVPNLQAIDLHNNPLQYDEQLCNVINWLEKLSVYPIEYFDGVESLDQTLGNDIDNFTTNQWSEFRKKKCPEPQIEDDEEDYKDNEEADNNVNYKVMNPADDNEEDDDYDYDENYDEDEEEDGDNDRITAEIIEDNNINLARASSILYIISVFVLTALAVLITAVTFTLVILKRNSKFPMHKANLPRLKIPLWDAQPGQKKHSGSVYRPLSEDLSGPKTPKCSRYEFSATPTVHTTKP